ncbi:MAG TPA: DNA replication/repair protein RecF [Xanthomonadaceae bacterium]|nr:DNA replication/repair protein RecF [Xanthomonadaceae bacterium]
MRVAAAPTSAGVRLETLELHDFRLFEAVELAPPPGISLITGGNGAGKTSLLEAVFVLGHGRSFRGGSRAGLIRHGATAFRIHARWQLPDGGVRRTGLERSVRGWQARLDGRELEHLSELYRACSAVCFEPGSHALLAGASEGRRQFLDWGLFHVEPGFLALWRRYLRALRQRNALLKRAGAAAAELQPWEHELAEAGERLTALRAGHAQRLDAPIRNLCRQFLPELGAAAVRLQPGWPQQAALGTALQAARGRDLAAGFTTVGAHRDDWRLDFEALPARAPLSRGQEKLAALACVLGQAQALTRAGAPWPVLLLDDLASELDRPHQGKVWDLLQRMPAQVLITATESPDWWPLDRVGARFHVEQARVERLL